MSKQINKQQQQMTPRHIIFKLYEIKEKNVERNQWGKNLTYSGEKIWITSDFFSGTMQVRRE